MMEFWDSVDQQGPDECWPWLGGINDRGYGYLYVGGRQYRAHRVAYALTIGPVPEGKVLDHVEARGCTRRDCCNPAHMEPVTIGENVKRGRNARRDATHCKNGHEWTPENTRFDVKRNRRACRQCDRDRRPRKVAA